MRFVDCNATPTPDALNGPDSRGGKERERARKYFEALHNPVPGAAPPRAVEFEAYGDDGVKLALTKLFHGKCAYCESYYRAQAPVDVEHYRPKGRVAGEPDHDGYWWLAMSWENLLPSCIDCNRRRWQDLPDLPNSLEQLFLAPEIVNHQAALGKQDLFPVKPGTRAKDETGLPAEVAWLIDPGREDPSQYLTYHISPVDRLAIVLPVVRAGVPDPRGLHSIHVYGLNRLGLVQERTRILRKLEFLRLMLEDLTGIADTLSQRPEKDDQRMGARIRRLCDHILTEIRHMAGDDQPYCSLVRTWAKFNHVEPDDET